MTTGSEHDNHEMTMSGRNEIIWAMSARGKYAHVYTGLDELAAGTPLCGLACTPTRVMEHFNLSDEIYRAVACPDCISRLPYAHLLKPVSAFCKQQKTEKGM